MRQFSDKSAEKVACEKTYRLKLEFYSTERKLKNIIKRILTSLIMHPLSCTFEAYFLDDDFNEIWMHDYWNENKCNDTFHFSVSFVEL